MSISDPIADMLTRIRNASRARHAEVLVPASKLKTEMAQILVREGFVASFEETRTVPENFLKITLKYVDGKVPVVSGLKRISKPGLRICLEGCLCFKDLCLEGGTFLFKRQEPILEAYLLTLFPEELISD